MPIIPIKSSSIWILLYNNSFEIVTPQTCPFLHLSDDFMAFECIYVSIGTEKKDYKTEHKLALRSRILENAVCQTGF